MMASNGQPVPGTSSEESRIFVDNTNLSELKSTCDDAVERVSSVLSFERR